MVTELELLQIPVTLQEEDEFADDGDDDGIDEGSDEDEDEEEDGDEDEEEGTEEEVSFGDADESEDSYE